MLQTSGTYQGDAHNYNYGNTDTQQAVAPAHGLSTTAT